MSEETVQEVAERTRIRHAFRQAEKLYNALDLIDEVKDDWPEGIDGGEALAQARELTERSAVELEAAGEAA